MHVLLGSVLALVVIVGGIAVLSWSRKRWPRLFVVLRLLLLARYSVFTALCLPGIVLLGLYVAPNLFYSLLVLDRPIQLFNVTWMTLLVATMALVTFQVTTLNAPERFEDYRLAREQLAAGRPGTGWRLRWLALLALGLPLPITCWICTMLDPSDLWLAELGAWPSALYLLGGLAASLLLIILLTAVQQTLLHPDGLTPDLLPFESSRWAQWLKDCRFPLLYGVSGLLSTWLLLLLGPGYQRSAHDAKRGTIKLLTPGHAEAIFCLLVLLSAYLGSYAWASAHAWVPDETFALPSLFFMLVVVLWTGCLLTGMAFCLDYYRVPVSLTILGLTAVMFLIFRVDHFYELDPEGDKQRASSQLVEFRQVIERRPLLKQTDGKKTLVVVTSAGGGIQASAWTAEVLAGLHEELGPGFTNSIGLMSMVSGGSVGAMFYLSHLGDGPDPLDGRALARVRELAQAPSLEAAAWGISFPDLIRSLFPPLILDKRVDRGWVMEKAWRNRLHASGADSDTRFSDWAAKMAAGKMPAIVFNATLVETGGRLLISPVKGPPPSKPLEVSRLTDAREFICDFGSESNLPIVTAARLSATFPYVSPVCRPLRRDGRTRPDKDHHVADGGYADNFGIVTAVQWIERLVEDYNEPGRSRGPRPFDRIVLVRIQSLPMPERAVEAGLDKGWAYEIWGPLKTMEQVRGASQAERGSLEVELLTELRQAQKAAAERRFERDYLLQVAREQRLPAKNIAEGAKKLRSPAARQRAENLEKVLLATTAAEVPLVEPVQIESHSFQFPPSSSGEADVPLSWKLTTRQKARLAEAWKTLKNMPAADNPVERLRRSLGLRKP